jgi:hypothetical protein
MVVGKNQRIESPNTLVCERLAQTVGLRARVNENRMPAISHEYGVPLADIKHGDRGLR